MASELDNNYCFEYKFSVFIEIALYIFHHQDGDRGQGFECILTIDNSGFYAILLYNFDFNIPAVFQRFDIDFPLPHVVVWKGVLLIGVEDYGWLVFVELQHDGFLPLGLFAPTCDN